MKDYLVVLEDYSVVLKVKDYAGGLNDYSLVLKVKDYNAVKG